MQSFLSTPNFDEVFFYKKPLNLYQEFCNAFAYYKQAILCDPTPNRQKLANECLEAWKQVKHHDKPLIYEKIHEYFDTVPSLTRSHQSFFQRNNVARSSRASLPVNTPSFSQQLADTLPKKALGQ